MKREEYIEAIAQLTDIGAEIAVRALAYEGPKIGDTKKSLRDLLEQGRWKEFSALLLNHRVKYLDDPHLQQIILDHARMQDETVKERLVQLSRSREAAEVSEEDDRVENRTLLFLMQLGKTIDERQRKAVNVEL